MEDNKSKNVSITYEEAKKVALDYSAKKIQAWGKSAAGATIVTLVGAGAYLLSAVNPGFLIATGLLTSASLFGTLINYANYRGLKKRLDNLPEGNPRQAERPGNTGQKILCPEGPK